MNKDKHEQQLKNTSCTKSKNVKLLASLEYRTARGDIKF